MSSAFTFFSSRLDTASRSMSISCWARNALIPGALAAAVLAGCADMRGILPQASLTQPAAVAVEASMQRVSPSPDSWPVETWWQRYGDTQLDALMREALADSPTVRIAEARMRQAVAAAGVAGASRYPQVTGGMKDIRQQFSANSMVPKPLAGNWAWVNDASANFSYEFDFWDKNRALVEAAAGRVRASEADAYASRLLLSVAITQVYLRLDQQYAQLELAQSTLKQREAILALTHQRVAAQIDSEVELKQAEQAVSTTREQIAAAQEAIALSQAQLAALIGKGPDRGLQIVRPRLSDLPSAGIPENLSADLIGRRPDIVALRWKVEASSRDIDVARAQFYPNVNLTAFIGFQSLGFGNFLDAGSQSLGIGPAVSLPIFDGGRLRGNLGIKTAEYDIAVEQYNQGVIDAVRDVVAQLTSIKWLQDRTTQQSLALQAAQDAYDLAMRRYKAGLGNYLQVLIAEGQVLAQKRARIELASRGYELDLNLVRALGGGYRGSVPQDAIRRTAASAATPSTTYTQE